MARLAVEYLSRSGELGSFRCATELHWDASSGQLWQEEGEPSWYRDATWVQNRVPLLRLASGKRAPDGGLVLHSGYVGTSNTKRHGRIDPMRGHSIICISAIMTASISSCIAGL